MFVIWIKDNKETAKIALGNISKQRRHDCVLTQALHFDVEKLCIASAKEFTKGKESFRLHYT